MFGSQVLASEGASAANQGCKITAISRLRNQSDCGQVEFVLRHTNVETLQAIFTTKVYIILLKS